MRLGAEVAGERVPSGGRPRALGVCGQSLAGLARLALWLGVGS